MRLGVSNVFFWTSLWYLTGADDDDETIKIIPITNANIRTAVSEYLANAQGAKETYGDIRYWDTSSVNDMSNLFDTAKSFNRDISRWNTSNVTTMAYMFYRAEAFAQDISDWDVSKVTDLSFTFTFAYAFSSDLSTWDVSQVTTMEKTFYYCTDAFNSSLRDWDVSGVTTMASMFQSAYVFNGDISTWDVSSVTDMHQMFFNAYAFNSDISGWDVSNVQDMYRMFYEATAFNRYMADWDISSVTDMTEMFEYAASFEQYVCWDKYITENDDQVITTDYKNWWMRYWYEGYADCQPVPSSLPTPVPTPHPRACLGRTGFCTYRAIWTGAVFFIIVVTRFGALMHIERQLRLKQEMSTYVPETKLDLFLKFCCPPIYVVKNGGSKQQLCFASVCCLCFFPGFHYTMCCFKDWCTCCLKRKVYTNTDTLQEEQQREAEEAQRKFEEHKAAVAAVIQDEAEHKEQRVAREERRKERQAKAEQQVAAAEAAYAAELEKELFEMVGTEMGQPIVIKQDDAASVDGSASVGSFDSDTSDRPLVLNSPQPASPSRSSPPKAKVPRRPKDRWYKETVWTPEDFVRDRETQYDHLEKPDDWDYMADVA